MRRPLLAATTRLRQNVLFSRRLTRENRGSLGKPMPARGGGHVQMPAADPEGKQNTKPRTSRSCAHCRPRAKHLQPLFSCARPMAMTLSWPYGTAALGTIDTRTHNLFILQLLRLNSHHREPVLPANKPANGPTYAEVFSKWQLTSPRWDAPSLGDSQFPKHPGGLQVQGLRVGWGGSEG